MEEKDRGFVKINRKIMSNWLWLDDKFSKGQAWIDLLLNTQYKDGFFPSKRGSINYTRGDCTLSLSELARRWKWSRNKVRSFLDILENKEMIKRKMVKYSYSIVTILNYDKYQGKEKNYKSEDSDFDYDKARAFLIGDEDE